MTQHTLDLKFLTFCSSIMVFIFCIHFDFLASVVSLTFMERGLGGRNSNRNSRLETEISSEMAFIKVVVGEVSSEGVRAVKARRQGGPSDSYSWNSGPQCGPLLQRRLTCVTSRALGNHQFPRRGYRRLPACSLLSP